MSASVNPLPPRSRNLTIIVVLLAVISVLSIITLLTTEIRLGQPTLPQDGQSRQFPQNGNFQPGQDNNVPQGNSQRDGGNFQGNGGNQRRGTSSLFSLFGAASSLGINYQYIRYISIGMTILGIILTLVTAFFVWKQKRWALNLAIVLAILFLLGALPGLFTLGGRSFSWLPTSLNIFKTLASIPIIILGILPSVRDSVR